mmetsp:Transcript_6938/g.15816  ORF Transcript_6938/g.15816 Transcript_6938/m.15816 type:complete len:500 (-) Transcript_6938:202-1701(-)|eukprot:CAMPEP_0206441824 /NCGR_PEP_ID=MMETSP0324_2-20121206/13486_1 /ASSEMBLY_ACC=CAM_ASM_000836 /TAXON_ID=2866 /ORGANISM="Crypthecodinium cohnii, Strain Seligo" /LENGTH=499 /DNA_ID=CAMNT_0053909609 /DNA_START=575 /DNA_END=2074 /DNA_ORIENTATION=-
MSADECNDRAGLTDPDVPSWQKGYQGDLLTPAGWAGLAKARLQSFRSRLCLAELSGSLGDLGTLIPLLAACSKVGSVRLGPGLLWMGIFNVVSALQWDIPVPVQPMKSIAAVAISDGMSPEVFAASGILAGGIVMLLGVTRLIDVANALVPKCIVAGMQVGLGTKMAATGCGYWTTVDWFDLNGKLTALLVFAAGTAMLVRTKLPSALIVFCVGVVLAAIDMHKNGAKLVFEGLELPVIVPSGKEWSDGFIKGTLPQLPLTTLNSVVSVCALSVDLFRSAEEGGKGISRVSVASSVGILNLVGCWFGGMPSCHGAGGLAGQYKFGARGGCAILMLGLAKIALALIFGQGVDTVVQYYPTVVLGVLVVFAGVELASVGIRSIARSPKLEEDLLPCFVTAAAYIGTKNMALGFCAGFIVATVQRAGVVPLPRLRPDGHLPISVNSNASTGGNSKGERSSAEQASSGAAATASAATGSAAATGAAAAATTTTGAASGADISL